MSAYVKIWAIASLINAIISSLIIMTALNEKIFSVFFLILIFSFVLSIPILVVAMLIAAIVLSQQTGDNIFGTVFIVTLFSSIAGVIFCKDMLGIVNNNPLPLGVSVVLSALTATIIIFRNN